MGMKKMAALVMALVLCLTAVGAMAATLKVPEGYSTIQNAIDAASENTTIEVSYNDGTPYEPFVVNKKGITVKGISENGNKPVIKFGHNGTPTNSGNASLGCGGVVYNADDFTIENFKFVGTKEFSTAWNASAIGYYYENTVSREGLTVKNCDFVGDEKTGIAIFTRFDSQITGCTFTNFGTGIFTEYTPSGDMSTEITNNTFSKVGQAVSLSPYRSNTTGNHVDINISGNNLNDADVIVFQYANGSEHNTIDDLTIKNNSGSGDVVVQDILKETKKNLDDSVIRSYSSEELAMEETKVGEKFTLNYNKDSEETYVKTGEQTKEVYIPPVVSAGSTALPQTGDNSSLLMWASLLAMAMVGFVASRKTRLN